MDKVTALFLGLGAAMIISGYIIVIKIEDYVLFLSGAALIIGGAAFLSIIFFSHIAKYSDAMGRFSLTAIGLSLLTIGVILALLYSVNKYYPIYGGIMIVIGLQILLISGRARV